MVQKVPSQISQRIAPRIWEKQDDVKSATQAAQSLPVICTQQGPDMGTRCQDLTSQLCNWSGQIVKFLAQIGSRRQTNLFRRQYSGTENREVSAL